MAAVIFNGDEFINAMHICSMVTIKLGFGSTELLEPLVSYDDATEYFIHPEYDRPLKHHDVALIRIPQRIKETGETQCSYIEFKYHSK